MPTPKKEQNVAEIQNRLARCTIAITTNYRGLSVTELTELRQRLREVGAEYQVVKNTLARIAAEQSGKPQLANILEGPTGIAFGYDDAIVPARVITEYIRITRRPLAIVGALIDGRVLAAQEVTALSLLPPREQLIAQVVGGMQSPLVKLVIVLSAHLRGLLTVLQGRIQQLEEGR